jgi:hypothetical protein
VFDVCASAAAFFRSFFAQTGSAATSTNKAASKVLLGLMYGISMRLNVA